MSAKLYFTKEELRVRHCLDAKTYRAKHKEKVKEGKARWRASNLDKVVITSARSVLKRKAKHKIETRNWQIRQYGITPEQYASLLEKQNNVCAICKKPDAELRQLSVDHNHKCCATQAKCCGKCVRGLLCGKCNRLLPLAEEYFTQVGEYLTSYAEV